MDALAPLRASAPTKKLKTKARHAFEIVSERSGQVLVVTSDDPLDAYQLDGPGRVTWPPGIRVPEGVVLGEVDERYYVVFIELKGTDDATKGKKGKVIDATEQLESMLDHFHPFERSNGPRGHGDDHHDGWAARDDCLAMMPRKDHAVVGLALYRRLGARPPADVRTVGGREVVLLHAPFHGASYGRLEVSLAKLIAPLK